jgi:peptide/nickel transport system permease protein
MNTVGSRSSATSPRPSPGLLRRLRRDGALIPVLILGTVVLAAILADVLPLADPRKSDLTSVLLPPFSSAAHPLGTDSIGRDTLSRLVFGARISLVVGFTSVAIAVVFGSFVGMVAGYFGGWPDTILMRLGDVQLSMPSFILALTIMAIFGPGIPNVIIALSIAGWVRYARVVRSNVLPLHSAEYVEAARGLGCSPVRVMWRHILPNVQSPVIVLATLGIGANIIAESSLSFLGLGIDPQNPSWGSMLANGRSYLETAWWVAALPGLAISITVLAANLLGDWFRDVLDPRMRMGRTDAQKSEMLETLDTGTAAGS